MAHQAALDEGELHRLNLRSVRDWIEANKNKVKARPNKTVLYSGGTDDLDVVKNMTPADQAAFKSTPLWKRIEKHRKAHQDRDIPFDRQTLESVLKTIRDHPVIVDRDRRKQHFSSAYDCFDALAGLPKLLPDAKTVASKSWDRLSEIFASNPECDMSAAAKDALLKKMTTYGALVDRRYTAVMAQLQASRSELKRR